MKLNQVRDNKGARKKTMVVGRGIGCTKGKTCGRGVKGQKARTGVRLKAFEGGQSPLIRRMPKRGFKNTNAARFAELNLDRLQQAIDDGRVNIKDMITFEVLREAGVVSYQREGVRLLGGGELKAKVQLTVAGATASAKAAVEKAGGSVTVLQEPAVKAQA